MIHSEPLRQLLSDTFQSSIQTVDIAPLPGDASNRAYYRLRWEKGGVPRSAILMEMNDAEGAKTSDEAGGGPADVAELPFINIQRHLSACKIPVPEIYFFDEGRGWLLLEDLGDNRLAEWVEGHPEGPARTIDYYKKAIDALISMQLDATPLPNPPTIAHQRRFDRSLFEWEFDHFIEYGIEVRNGTAMAAEKKQALRSLFSDIAGQLAALPQVFTHRDYHSRNLMIEQDPTGFKLGIIDFQDALMGPPQYDLASLLRDSYIDLPEAMIDDLLDYYYDQSERRSGLSIDRAVFREAFDLMSIQRNLKAAGRFVFIDTIKKKDHLLPFVAPTLAKLKTNLKKYQGLKPLHEILAAHVAELDKA